MLLCVCVYVAQIDLKNQQFQASTLKANKNQ